MEIIKPGTKKQKAWAKNYKCSGSGNGGGGCGALLRVEVTDLYYTRSGCGRDDYETTYVTFTCPQCLVKTDIKPGISSGIHYDEAAWKRHVQKVNNNKEDVNGK